jgi:iron complex transport system ATP-binding protein
MILSVSDLSFRYNGAPTLADITFSVERHEIAAVLGPNGAGKTTLLRTINSVLKPHTGVVCIDGTDILSSSPRDVAKKTAYVSQRSEPGRVTAFDAVLLGRKPHIGWRVTHEDVERARAVMRALNIEELSLRYVDEMSGGEYQKVCLARSVAQDPTAMLLDEPTSSLDLRNQIEILRLIRDIARSREMCVLMSMHDLNTALRYADKFIFLSDGKIRAVVTGDDVTPEVIEEVYGVEVALHSYGEHPVVVPVSVVSGKGAD